MIGVDCRGQSRPCTLPRENVPVPTRKLTTSCCPRDGVEEQSQDDDGVAVVQFEGVVVDFDAAAGVVVLVRNSRKGTPHPEPFAVAKYHDEQGLPIALNPSGLAPGCTSY